MGLKKLPGYNWNKVPVVSGRYLRVFTHRFRTSSQSKTTGSESTGEQSGPGPEIYKMYIVGNGGNNNVTFDGNNVPR